MTTWTNITNAAVAVGGIPSSATVTALRDNPSAVAESSTGAPVVFAGWHPADKVTVGDGKTGLIYDFAVNGTVSTVVTPDFEDGYEYRLVAVDLTSNSASNVRLTLDGFYATDGYNRMRLSSEGLGTSFIFGFDITIETPRLAKTCHFANGWTHRGSNLLLELSDAAAYVGTAQKLLRARVRFTVGSSTSGSIVGGKIFMFRRREYASLP